jgi:hypothetical protein
MMSYYLQSRRLNADETLKVTVNESDSDACVMTVMTCGYDNESTSVKKETRWFEKERRT